MKWNLPLKISFECMSDGACLFSTEDTKNEKENKKVQLDFLPTKIGETIHAVAFAKLRILARCSSFA